MSALLPAGFSDRPFKQPLTVTAPAIVWLAVHGNLCLAMRHPANRGPSSGLIDHFVLQLGGYLVDAGVLQPDELAAAEGLEAVETTRQCEVCGCTDDAGCAAGCSWDPAYLLQGRTVCSRCLDELGPAAPTITLLGET